MQSSPLEISIKSIDELNEVEKERTAEIDRLAFTGDNGPGDIEWSTSDWLVMGSVDGTIISQIGIVVRKVAVGDQHILAGGVGGVATHPDYRRHGYAGLLLRAAEQLMRDLDLEFGILVCGEERMPYYASFGWQKIDNRTIFQNQGQDREMDGIMMVLPLKDQAWPSGLLNLNGKPW
jgi:aminoglycoside 2'-N-acetyltransferase I